MAGWVSKRAPRPRTFAGQIKRVPVRRRAGSPHARPPCSLSLSLGSMLEELVLARETVLAASGFLGAYTALHPLWPSEKRRAWIITFLAAAFSVVTSLPFLMDVVCALGDVRVLSESNAGRAELAELAVHVFQGYLVADLVAGALHYAGQINVLTGWCHHIVYILLLQYVLARSAPWTSIFALALVMELPTLLLAAARLVPRARHDGLFNAAFFATRICLHLALIAAFTLPANRPDGSWAPAALFVAAFPLHAFWFGRQLQLRAAAARRAKAHIVVPLRLDVTITSGSPASRTVQEPDDSALAALKSPPPEEVEESPCSSSSSSSSSSSEDDLIFVPSSPPPSPELDLHLLRHALKESAAAAEEPLRIRAMLIAASRGRYAALAARARGLYREAWVRNRPSLAAYARAPTALRREIAVN